MKKYLINSSKHALFRNSLKYFKPGFTALTYNYGAYSSGSSSSSMQFTTKSKDHKLYISNEFKNNKVGYFSENNSVSSENNDIKNLILEELGLTEQYYKSLTPEPEQNKKQKNQKSLEEKVSLYYRKGDYNSLMKLFQKFGKDISDKFSLEKGPLPKNIYTHQIELLTRIALYDNTKLSFYIKKDNNLYAKLPNSEEINVSEALSYANFEQISISHEEVKLCFARFKECMFDFLYVCDNSKHKLHENKSLIDKKLLRFYTEEGYKLINKFLRNEMENFSHQSDDPLIRKFIISVLIANALKKGANYSYRYSCKEKEVKIIYNNMKNVVFNSNALKDFNLQEFCKKNNLSGKEKLIELLIIDICTDMGIVYSCDYKIDLGPIIKSTLHDLMNDPFSKIALSNDYVEDVFKSNILKSIKPHSFYRSMGNFNSKSKRDLLKKIMQNFETDIPMPVRQKGFVSSSMNNAIIIDGEVHVIYDPTTSFIDIKDLSCYISEAEGLGLPNKQFAFTNYLKAGNKHFFLAKEVASISSLEEKEKIHQCTDINELLNILNNAFSDYDYLKKITKSSSSFDLIKRFKENVSELIRSKDSYTEALLLSSIKQNVKILKYNLPKEEKVLLNKVSEVYSIIKNYEIYHILNSTLDSIIANKNATNDAKCSSV